MTIDEMVNLVQEIKHVTFEAIEHYKKSFIEIIKESTDEDELDVAVIGLAIIRKLHNYMSNDQALMQKSIYGGYKISDYSIEKIAYFNTVVSQALFYFQRYHRLDDICTSKWFDSLYDNWLYDEEFNENRGKRNEKML